MLHICCFVTLVTRSALPNGKAFSVLPFGTTLLTSSRRRDEDRQTVGGGGWGRDEVETCLSRLHGLQSNPFQQDNSHVELFFFLHGM